MANKDVIALKESKVNELSKNIKESKLVLLVDYRGITVADAMICICVCLWKPSKLGNNNNNSK